MSSPYLRSGALLVDYGYSAIPIIPGKKMPGEFKYGHWQPMINWNQFCTRLPTEDEVERWCNWPLAGIGVALGPASSLVALDFDNDVDGLHARIQEYAGKSPVKKAGARGYTAFYRYSGEPSKRFKKEDRVTVVELLSLGTQTVMPYSVHPDGMAYRYLTQGTLEDMRADQLPSLPADFLDVIESWVEPRREAPRPVAYVPSSYEEAGLDEVAEAVKYIPAEEYHLWIEIGMGLKSEFGDRAFSVWDSWSGSSPKYNGREMRKKWLSFTGTGITKASIFHHAMGCGYVNHPRPLVHPATSLNIAPGGDLEVFLLKRGEVARSPEKPEATPETPETLVSSTGLASSTPSDTLSNIPAALLQAPGLVGEIANWITETAIQPQPALSLAAALCAVGVLKGHRVRSETNLRTNIFCMSVAPSSSGKDHPRECVEQLLNTAGLSALIGGAPASGSGLLAAVREGRGRRLIQIDEMGRLLKAINSNRAASHQAEIINNMMMLFSSARTMFRGLVYANPDGKNKPKDIDQPCLCVNGSTVPGRLYDSLSSEDAIDGFLSRWLIFESFDPNPETHAGGDIQDPPAALISAVVAINNWPTNTEPRGDIDQNFKIRPLVVQFTPEARGLLLQFTDGVNRRRVAEYHKGNGFDAIWGRTREHAIKLALTAADNDAIGAAEMKWACELAWTSSEYMQRIAKDRISGTDREASMKFMLEKIDQISKKTPGGWCSMRDLSQAVNWKLKRTERDDMLNSLLEMQAIAAEQYLASGRQSYRYKIIS